MCLQGWALQAAHWPGAQLGRLPRLPHPSLMRAAGTVPRAQLRGQPAGVEAHAGLRAVGATGAFQVGVNGAEVEAHRAAAYQEISAVPSIGLVAGRQGAEAATVAAVGESREVKAIA